MRVGATGTRILLADDHKLVRQGLTFLLDQQPDFTVVAQAGDGADAVELAMQNDITLAVLDVAMPVMTGLQAAQEIHRRKPDVPILALSMHSQEQFILEAFRAGASGYVLKSAADRELIHACRSAIAGAPFVFPEETTALAREVIRQDTPNQPPEIRILSDREQQVLKLTAEGHTTDETATLLFLSVRTVENHRARIMKKLQMRDRTDLTRYAIRTGLVEP